MAEPIAFTIIIPTRERADTLAWTLRTVLDQQWPRLNIIVSDNASRDNTREVVESFADSRIRYINTGRRISMSHNWEFALGHVNEGWVGFVGDDDGLLPGALERVARVIEATGARTVVSRWRFYFWPGAAGPANQLMVHCGSGYEVRDSSQWLRRLMDGRVVYHDLPHIYSGGFADVALLRASRNAEGTFFCSMTPDVYSAIALASTHPSYVMIHEPIAVMGVSAHSNGASNFSPNAPPGPSEQFFSEPNIPFHAALGSNRVKSIPIVVYESYLQALHLHGNRLHVRLRDQLILALAQAAPADRAAIRAYCEEILLREDPPQAALPSDARMVLRRLADRLRGLPGLGVRLADLTVDASDYDVRDIQGAARLSRDLYLAERRRGWGRSRRALAALVRRLPWRRG
ncbi:glycosyltransferase family 2 protein [Caenimonas aquaedulcis]|uniref:Glycosyltransferase family 2 protein n=1 Tax=Caenimonas aquaedulcis TaxID=2793270 RepID=A0A931H592_9BURK|nr:glycosyltransferase family 2 protein [Caenimonas aquaedulcis]